MFARKEYCAKAADVYSLGVMLIGSSPYKTPRCASCEWFATGRIHEPLTIWKRLRLVTEDALDLLNKMFHYEEQRITLDEVLRHPFLKVCTCTSLHSRHRVRTYAYAQGSVHEEQKVEESEEKQSEVDAPSVEEHISAMSRRGDQVKQTQEKPRVPPGLGLRPRLRHPRSPTRRLFAGGFGVRW